MRPASDDGLGKKIHCMYYTVSRISLLPPTRRPRASFKTRRGMVSLEDSWLGGTETETEHSLHPSWPPSEAATARPAGRHADGNAHEPEADSLHVTKPPRRTAEERAARRLRRRRRHVRFQPQSPDTQQVDGDHEPLSGRLRRCLGGAVHDLCHWSEVPHPQGSAGAIDRLWYVLTVDDRGPVVLTILVLMAVCVVMRRSGSSDNA